MSYSAQNVRPNALSVLFGVITVGCMVAPAQATSITGADHNARQICQTVIRLQPGQRHFDGCVSSLSDSLENARYYRAVAQARNRCLAQDVQAESAELSLCLLRAADAKPAEMPEEKFESAYLMAGVADDPQSSKPYSAVSFDIALRRERQACALVGLDPAFGAFANCVSDLQTALRDADVPGD